MLEKVVRKSISRPIIIYIIIFKRGRVPLLPVSVQTIQCIRTGEKESPNLLLPDKLCTATTGTTCHNVAL